MFALGRSRLLPRDVREDVAREDDLVPQPKPTLVRRRGVEHLVLSTHELEQMPEIREPVHVNAREKARDMLSGLSDEEFDILWMRHVEQMTYAQIAENKGISIKKVRRAGRMACVRVRRQSRTK